MGTSAVQYAAFRLYLLTFITSRWPSYLLTSLLPKRRMRLVCRVTPTLSSNQRPEINVELHNKALVLYSFRSPTPPGVRCFSSCLRCLYVVNSTFCSGGWMGTSRWVAGSVRSSLLVRVDRIQNVPVFVRVAYIWSTLSCLCWTNVGARAVLLLRVR